MINITKKEGESINSLIYRFTKRVQQSGVLREAKRRKFHGRPINRRRRRLSALHREVKRQEFEKAKKMGMV